MSSFRSLGLPADILDALDAHGIDDAFPIQAATIPDALAGRDVSGRAPTGSGKTLAFGIPLVARAKHAGPKKPKALVLLPTRELAAQVARELTWLGIERDLRVQAFYGGVGFEPQVKALRRGVDVAVGCPGRLADLISQHHLRLDGVEIVVVDEADRMADMGFLPEVRGLLDQTSPTRQTLLFSATLDGDVDVLVKRYQRNPVRHEVTPPERDAGRVTHHLWEVERTERTNLTAQLIARTGTTVVFSRTRHGADRIAQQLRKLGVTAAPIHGSRSQAQRDRALAAFASGEVQALVATDVAARGIHVDGVACVVHYDLPPDPKDYVHRSGRTGRAEADGTVVAFVLADQRKLAGQIVRAVGLDTTVSAPALDAVGDPGVAAVAVAAAAAARAAREPGEARTGSQPRRTGRPEHRNDHRGDRRPTGGTGGSRGSRDSGSREGVSRDAGSRGGGSRGSGSRDRTDRRDDGTRRVEGSAEATGRRGGSAGSGNAGGGRRRGGAGAPTGSAGGPRRGGAGAPTGSGGGPRRGGGGNGGGRSNSSGARRQGR